MKKLINLFIITILQPLLYSYERWIMYRISAAWGKVHLHNIKNKGDNVKIAGYSRFLDPENLHLGNNVRIGYGCFFYCKGGIEIKDNTILSRNITIYSSNHNYMGNAIPYDDSYIHKPIKIGKGVWIGMGVMITPGVEIGDGAIIGMGTVISKNIKPGEIVVGAEQRAVSMRDLENFNKLQAEGRVFSKIWPDS